MFSSLLCGDVTISHLNLVNCVDEEMRLVGRSTNREGRVEVCVDGRWGTVCNSGIEGIAGAVCSQLGFPAEGKKKTTKTIH